MHVQNNPGSNPRLRLLHDPLREWDGNKCSRWKQAAVIDIRLPDNCDHNHDNRVATLDIMASFTQRLVKSASVLEHGSIITSMQNNGMQLLIPAPNRSTTLAVRECMSNYIPHKTMDAINHPCPNLSCTILVKVASGRVFEDKTQRSGSRASLVGCILHWWHDISNIYVLEGLKHPMARITIFISSSM